MRARGKITTIILGMTLMLMASCVTPRRVNYLQDMTAPHIRLGERFGYMSFGYLWYSPFDDRQICAAIGDGGNIIYADKESRISVGMTGTFKPRIYDRVDFIEKYVLPVA